MAFGRIVASAWSFCAAWLEQAQNESAYLRPILAVSALICLRKGEPRNPALWEWRIVLMFSFRAWRSGMNAALVAWAWMMW